MHLKKRVALGAIAAMAASLAVAVPSASAAEVANCTFNGLAGGITPGVPAVLGPNGPTGGSGVYTFGGNALSCSYANSATGVIVPTTAARINSRGSFSNLVCSTGTADGDPAAGGTTIDFTDPRVPDVTSASYHIQFVGGQGVMTVASFNGQAVTGGGYVNITPHTGNCVNEDVTAFDVAGSFTVTR